MKYLALILISFICTLTTTESEPTPFNIEIRSDKDSVKLTCLSGCQWDDLEIMIKRKPPKRINVNNMGLYFNDMKPLKAPDFQFDVKYNKRSKKLILQSLKGTSWENLDLEIGSEQVYSLNEDQIMKK